MTYKRITTTIDEEKLERLKKKEGKIVISEILNTAIDGLLLDLHPEYTEEINAEEKKIHDIENLLIHAEKKKEEWEGTINALKSKCREHEERVGVLKENAAQNKRSIRISQLLREINQAIVYNEYNVSDIIIAVNPQIEELRSLSPDFDLVRQIEIIRSINA